VLDLVRDIFPGLALAFHGLDVVVDVLEVEVVVLDAAAPEGAIRHRLGFEDLQRAQAEVTHPLRLVLQL
jgi:hypothetical protein